MYTEHSLQLYVAAHVHMVMLLQFAHQACAEVVTSDLSKAIAWFFNDNDVLVLCFTWLLTTPHGISCCCLRFLPIILKSLAKPMVL